MLCQFKHGEKGAQQQTYRWIIPTADYSDGYHANAGELDLDTLFDPVGLINVEDILLEVHVARYNRVLYSGQSRYRRVDLHMYQGLGSEEEDVNVFREDNVDNTSLIHPSSSTSASRAAYQLHQH